MFFKVKPTTKMGKVFAAYASKKSVEQRSIKFLFDVRAPFYVPFRRVCPRVRADAAPRPHTPGQPHQRDGCVVRVQPSSLSCRVSPSPASDARPHSPGAPRADTPESLGLENEDEIDAMLEMTGGWW